MFQCLGDLAEGGCAPIGIDLRPELTGIEKGQSGTGQAFETVIVITTCPVAAASTNASRSAAKIE